VSAAPARAAPGPRRAAPAADGGEVLRIDVPGDFHLPRDVCSYGYFLLEPNHWDPATTTLRRVLSLSDGPVRVLIAQPGATLTGSRGRGRPLRVQTDRPLDAQRRGEARAQIVRMLRLDEDEAHIRAFHRLDGRWRRSGRGRLFRSPTFFEDLVKTVTSCNIAWPSTVAMNLRLCRVLGRRAPSGDPEFPTPARLARTRPSTLRARCSVGYRDRRLVELARLVDRGGIDVAWLEDPSTPDEAVLREMLGWPGIGPYAAANLMQLLGRYAHLPLDTESVRHGRLVLGFRGSAAEVMRRVRAHFEPFGAHRFRAYWFELWAFYESRRGPSPTWEKARVGSSFTAARL
jgi:3-methyladenine DNA glycosylase/8-oxoguanine DNA glycosylase